MADWYYAKDGEPCGPVSEPELIKELGTGKLDRTTLVWTEGMATVLIFVGFISLMVLGEGGT